MARKLFVSIPMRGFSINDIRNEMIATKEILEHELDEKFDLIDTLFEEDIAENINPCYYLGKSIQKLAEADLCVFHPQWAEAHGCMIEHNICALYGIPYIHLYPTIEDQDILSEELD